MTTTPYAVGIVGLQPGRSWAARAHIGALRALPSMFEIVGVANSSKASAEAAAADAGLPRAFASVDEMLATPEIDLVTVAVKVPHHLNIVKAAIRAGKHIYCEWPLGNGLAEAEEMAGLARAAGIVGVVGTQAPFAPEIAYLRKLVADGLIGDILSTTVLGSGGALQGSGSIPDSRTYGYLLDRTNGATLVTIPLGHALAAVTSVLGPIAEVSAVIATRRTTAIVADSGERLPITSPDQALVAGLLASGAPISIHYRGGDAAGGDGLTWEIEGTAGVLRVTGRSGHVQMVDLSLQAIRMGERSFTPVTIPIEYRSKWPDDVEPGNVARVYAAMAQDILHGTHTAPSFDDAVKLHRLIDAIETAAETGRRVRVD